MTNQESQQQFLHWPIRSSSNLESIYKQNQDNDQIHHLPTRFIPLTYLQQEKEKPAVTFSAYVLCFFNLRNNQILDRGEKNVKSAFIFSYVLYKESL
jgi:hypothetical protein